MPLDGMAFERLTELTTLWMQLQQISKNEVAQIASMTTLMENETTR